MIPAGPEVLRETLTSVDHLCHSEVRNHKAGAGIHRHEENVLWFEITVGEARSMDVFEALQNLISGGECLKLRKTTSFLPADVGVEIAALEEFCEDVAGMSRSDRALKRVEMVDADAYTVLLV